MRQQAPQAEGLVTSARLVLRVAKSKTGYAGVYHDKRNMRNPYEARVRRGVGDVSLGHFATAEEAAMRVARSPEGRPAADRTN